MADTHIEDGMRADLADKGHHHQQRVIKRTVAKQRRAACHCADRKAHPAGSKDHQHIEAAVHALAHFVAHGKIQAHEHGRHKGHDVARQIAAGKGAVVRAHDEDAAQKSHGDSENRFDAHAAAVDENRDQQHHQRMQRRQHGSAGDVGQLDRRKPRKIMAEQKRSRNEAEKVILFADPAQFFSLLSIGQRRYDEERQGDGQPPKADRQRRRRDQIAENAGGRAEKHGKDRRDLGMPGYQPASALQITHIVYSSFIFFKLMS